MIHPLVVDHFYYQAMFYSFPQCIVVLIYSLLSYGS